MASAQAAQHWLANHKAKLIDVDDDYSTAAVVTGSVVDMRDYEGIVIIAMASALTGSGITQLEIVATDESDGTGNITQIATTGAVAADAVGDFVVLEATVEQMRHASDAGGYSSRYMGARLENDNAADEAVLAVIRYGYKHGPALNHTANTIA